ncbi:MAG TPA: PilZ domain-containing protein [Planctomycetota bacterium]|nr:PilZ domain-containing protein [Planctomycetota bacterium]
MSDQARTAVEVIEKRRFLRLNDYFRVSFRLLDRQLEPTGPAPEGLGWSKNLSIGGLCFVADGPAQPGEQVAAHVEIPEIEGGLSVVGEVVRCLEVKPGRHEIAIRFLPAGADERARERLERFIYRQFL